jgi:dipeptidyl aminopeptidase/acylaminoacyl peptidase
MKKIAAIATLIIMALSTAAIAQPAGLPDLIPREVLFGNPEKARPQISPDGKMISYLAPVDGVLNVWVKTIGKKDDYEVTFDTTQGIIFYAWTADSRRIIYVQDQEGNENYRLYSVNLRTGKIKDYTPFGNVRVRVVAWDTKFPNELIISMNKRNPQIYDAYHLNLRNGKLRMIAENPGNILGWMSDEDFKLRGALALNQEGGMDLLVRDDEESEWRTLVSWEFEEQNSSYPIGFSEDGEYVYLKDSRDANAARLVKVKVQTGELEIIAEDPCYDVGPVMFHPETGEVLGVSFLKDKRERVFFDEEVEADFDIINKLDDGEAGLADWTQDFSKWLISFNKDNGPIPYYLYDRKTKKAQFLFTHRPELSEYTLAQMEPITFTARDSLIIYGYITFPPGVERRNLPMVLNVHGGPWARDYWGYDPQAQWLANRGCICLQVNYRGSRGYGKDFTNAGNKEWGRKMHHDLVDAVNWAADKGYADPDRIAIYGGSYGGYAALVGATFTPDLFACAVDMFGPSNLITFLETVPPYWKPTQEMMYRRVGHPVEDSTLLWERSPLSRVDSIRIPMLIVQGANDPRVVQAESDQIVAAMEEKGIDYEYMLFEDEGHGFMKEENRLEFFAAAERFLAKHLGGRYEE